MIDSSHKMAMVVAHLMQYNSERELSPIRFPEPDSMDTPESLGFRPWWRPLPGMREDWRQSAQLLGEHPCVLHLCKDEHDSWFVYLTPGWKNGPFVVSARHPAIADNVAIIKRLAGLISAPKCFLIWNMHDKRTGDFTGEVIMCEQEDYRDEAGRLLRCYVTDMSFRIAWYADAVEKALYDALDAGWIRPLPLHSTRGSKLKDHMSMSRDVPEGDTTFCDVCKGLDVYDFCE